MRQYHCQAVIHFFGSKAVGESVEKPLFYYDNNVGGSPHFLQPCRTAVSLPWLSAFPQPSMTSLNVCL
ncbi:hypothetical protein [Gulbenkiania indica]|uniref:hypothetical protein n=1 Tax=Gulbenkiania indica TaxID=375574 RepID=UPI00247FA57F|nr:hypothetical protein [Gulbenkiania indica]